MKLERVAAIALILSLTVATGRVARAQGAPKDGTPAPKDGTPAPKDPAKPAEPEPLNKEATDKLLRLAYGFLREGNSDAAAASFRAAIRSLTGVPRQRVVNQLGDMFVLQGKWEKALRLFLEEKDFARAADVHAKAGREKEAVEAAKKSTDANALGRVYLTLKKYDDAAAAFGKAGALKDQGEALVAAGKHMEAAAIFEKAKEDALRATALEAGGDKAAAKDVWAAAKASEAAKVDKVLADSKAAKKAYDEANDPAERERLRYDFAKVLETAAKAYDRMATVFEKLGDRGEAQKHADYAVKAARAELEVYSDRGLDKFGSNIVKHDGLDEWAQKLDERASKLR